ncbi:hypothetical protein C5167_005654 [Papaver somniferum]|uniref:Uncharacterized protein n=1 Tax=Papaver somniferum TaxID=3469 RepID=A0A4Y7JCV0_PAPSO|nr:hypothetical protein C5167_005654 [Papaver somniferum]
MTMESMLHLWLLLRRVHMRNIIGVHTIMLISLYKLSRLFLNPIFVNYSPLCLPMQVVAGLNKCSQNLLQHEHFRSDRY